MMIEFSFLVVVLALLNGHSEASECQPAALNRLGDTVMEKIQALLSLNDPMRLPRFQTPFYAPMSSGQLTASNITVFGTSDLGREGDALIYTDKETKDVVLSFLFRLRKVMATSTLAVNIYGTTPGGSVKGELSNVDVRFQVRFSPDSLVPKLNVTMESYGEKTVKIASIPTMITNTIAGTLVKYFRIFLEKELKNIVSPLFEKIGQKS